MTNRSENPEVTVEVIRERLQGSFPGDLGIEPLELTTERSRGRLLVDERHLHPGGYVHGGVWAALADTTAAWGTWRNLPPGYDFTTLELKLNVFAAGRLGDELVATAEPRHVGRRTHVWVVDIHRGDRQVAMFTLTQFVIAPDGAEG
ncbi:MAG: PaaI family thioesterase [Actinomycetota bacterium]|nr:PaaI family thioesterase [Actinomycetota bacterium]